MGKDDEISIKNKRQWVKSHRQEVADVGAWLANDHFVDIFPGELLLGVAAEEPDGAKLALLMEINAVEHRRRFRVKIFASYWSKQRGRSEWCVGVAAWAAKLFHQNSPFWWKKILIDF